MGRILVADSDPHIRLLCQDELREEGYEVLVAANGRDALGLMESFSPDLVVLEIMLPDMSGLETLRIIKGTCRKTRVILHSTYGPPQTGSEPQFDGMVLKSHNLESLKIVVRRLLPGRPVPSNSRRDRSGPASSKGVSGVRHGFNGN